MKQNSNGFTLMEMLIVIAIIAILIAIAIPVFASQLERSREAADLANVRSAYAQVSTEAQLGNPASTVTVDLRQKQEDWQSIDPINIGGIVHSKNQGNTDNWKGVAAPNGTCVVSYSEDYGVILTWSGAVDPSAPKYPFNTSVDAKEYFQIRTMFRPFPSQSISWSTAFCSSRTAHGPISATEGMVSRPADTFSGPL